MAQNNNQRGDLFDKLLAEITAVKKENTDLKKEVDSFSEKTVEAVRDIFKDMVSILDEFSRVESGIAEKGLDQTDEGKKVRDRFLNVSKKLKRKLEDHGISEIVLSPGDIVNENLCATVDTEPDPSKDNDTIITIEKKGYMFRDIVLRPAEVIVVKN